LARKDGATVAKLAQATSLSDSRKRLLAALPSLYGGLEVLDRARALVGDDGDAQAALDELGGLCRRLGELGPSERLAIDLGEVRGFDYYTGTRFAIFADGIGDALVSGGRYDRLIERYGRPARAVGFALDVDLVADLLKARGVPAPRQSGGVLVAGDAVAAAKLSATLRARGDRAVLELDEPIPTDPELRRRAQRRALDRVAVAVGEQIRWLDESGPLG
jgi:ATP phosphoribosyltransferase regulatory subunit